ncbi:fasciclin domain protein [Pedobacter glucosidilyticus]|uniref:Fasciclin domain-containing protein n=1 Tax=Pedobacter aquae TaxID=2605747 RepID=A0A5C0VH56_9SPHI|nr:MULTISPECIES: fasciclin domain-containing protein [Pedobacter]KHJ39267.1 fasciclin domain protein [Pedobacter glucosidilyticus]QEK51387.1 fasciclin domain-containing protein [Pedobacter aquae]
MEKFFKYNRLPIIAIILLLILSVSACRKELFTQTTDDSVNITGFFEQEASEFSEFKKALKLTGNASYLAAYGTYTVFAPNNNAFKLFLEEQGKTSLEQVDLDVLKDVVKLHIIQDTISTTSFTDGKIKTPTALGQFLTSGATNEDGITSIIINKTARITRSNIKVGNGIIHCLDRVLQKSVRTLAQEIASKPELSIFNEALIATGWDIKLNAPVTVNNGTPSYVAVLAITNDVYRREGINSFTDLKNKYSSTNNPLNLTDSLNLYIAYKVLPGLKYMADIVTAPSHETKAPLEIISVKLSKDTVLFNEDIFAGVLEKGVSANRQLSDVSTTNGVLHFVNGDFSIKKRVPTAVFWDVADQPEFRQLPSIFRVSGRSQAFPLNSLRDIKWGGLLNPALTYSCNSTGNFAGAYFSDYISINLRTAVAQWIEFRTPVIIRGRYKVWISFRALRGSGNCQNIANASLNGVPFSRTVSFGESRIRTKSDPGSVATDPSAEELEAQGFKNPITFNSFNWNCRFLGTMDIQTTNRHIFRLDPLTNCNALSTTIDMIHFIPVDQNQLTPRFGPNGEIVY